MERSILILRNFFHFAIQLRCGRLIDAALICQATQTDGLEHTEYTHCIDISRELWRVEAHLHMALSGKVVNLCWLHLTDYLEHGHRVAQVGIVKVEVWSAFQMSDALTIIDRRTADGAMHFITLRQKELRKVRTVLTGDTCNQCNFSFHNLL